jgi:putative RNA 2'-phosphotransferase
MSKSSRRLSWLLRHGAGELGLRMDEAGWVDVKEVLAATGLDDATLARAVQENDKGRLQLDGTRIRACQGHSTEGMPITRAALEASWATLEPAGSLWHGTTLAALPGIASRGIESAGRTHVHLAEVSDSKIGKRARVEVLLEISARGLVQTGLGIFRAPNGVVLVRHVPPHCVTAVHARSAPPSVIERTCREIGFPVRPQGPATDPSAPNTRDPE